MPLCSTLLYKNCSRRQQQLGTAVSFSPTGWTFCEDARLRGCKTASCLEWCGWRSKKTTGVIRQRALPLLSPIVRSRSISFTFTSRLPCSSQELLWHLWTTVDLLSLFESWFFERSSKREVHTRLDSTTETHQCLDLGHFKYYQLLKSVVLLGTCSMFES